MTFYALIRVTFYALDVNTESAAANSLLMSASMTNVEDYERLPEILDAYYERMTSKAPAWVKEKYTRKMLNADFCCVLAFFFLSCYSVLMPPMFEQVEDPDFALYKLLAIHPPRVAGACRACGCLAELEELAAWEPAKEGSGAA